MQSDIAGPTVTVVVVAYGAEPWLERSVRAILESTGVVTDVVVVDNGCTDGLVDRVEGTAGVTIVRPGSNTGFAGGCNAGADVATGEFLALVNPDAIVEPDALAVLARVAERDEVGIATASIRLADEPDLLNSAGNEIHCTGVSWSGAFREKASDHDDERPTFAASGAGMMMRLSRWRVLGGFDPVFFAYYEDADLSVRSWQRGLQVVYVPGAVVVHRYEFSRRAEKYFLLERNRLLLVLSCYARRTLLLLSPLLAMVDVGFLLLSIREGWWRQKLRSWRWLLANRHTIATRRRAVQAARLVPDRELAALFSDDLLPGNYTAPAGWSHVNRLVRGYWLLVKPRL